MKYTCIHCKTGTVRQLPAVCPECERLLNTEVKNKYLYEEKNEQKNHKVQSWGFSY